jgi:hypothetical protein
MSTPSVSEPAPVSQTAPTEIRIRGSVRVLCEIRNAQKMYGDTPFSVDRSMLAHWATLIEEELSDELKARLPDMQRLLAQLEAAKKISSETLNAQVTI